MSRIRFVPTKEEVFLSARKSSLTKHKRQQSFFYSSSMHSLFSSWTLFMFIILCLFINYSFSNAFSMNFCSSLSSRRSLKYFSTRQYCHQKQKSYVPRTWRRFMTTARTQHGTKCNTRHHLCLSMVGREGAEMESTDVTNNDDWIDIQNNDDIQLDEYVPEIANVQNGLGDWVEMHGNYVLRPPLVDQEPRALIHFLGGAIVGAAPDISYRYVLERLAEKGFLIVATPYTLSFDYIATCDDIIGRFERIAPALARQFGPVPVVGVGHSCGALLQLLITTLFPDTPRAANALLSYNNKSVKEAIPLFDEVITPIFVQLGTNQSNPFNDFLGGSSDGSILPPNSLDLINIGIKLSRNVVKGDLPSDELLSEIAKRTTPKPLASILPQDVVVPSFVRESFQKLLNPLKESKANAGITPLLDQSLDVLEQIPLLIEEVANGARDFNPPPRSVQAAARRRYRARRTLVVQYDNDPLDESEQVETLLREAETVMRNKRPMVDFDVKRIVLKGGHATPCLAPPLDLASRVEDILGEDTAKNRLLYIGADETVDEIVKWLEEGNL